MQIKEIIIVIERRGNKDHAVISNVFKKLALTFKTLNHIYAKILK
jgi:hypothetical protein